GGGRRPDARDPQPGPAPRPERAVRPRVRRADPAAPRPARACARGAPARGGGAMTALDSPPHSRAEEHEKLTMVHALNRALDEAMAADERGLMFGGDVGPHGGAVRVTAGVQGRD